MRELSLARHLFRARSGRPGLGPGNWNYFRGYISEEAQHRSRISGVSPSSATTRELSKTVFPIEIRPENFDSEAPYPSRRCDSPIHLTVWKTVAQRRQEPWAEACRRLSEGIGQLVVSLGTRAGRQVVDAVGGRFFLMKSPRCFKQRSSPARCRFYREDAAEERHLRPKHERLEPCQIAKSRVGGCRHNDGGNGKSS